MDCALCSLVSDCALTVWHSSCGCWYAVRKDDLHFKSQECRDNGKPSGWVIKRVQGHWACQELHSVQQEEQDRQSAITAKFTMRSSRPIDHLASSASTKKKLIFILYSRAVTSTPLVPQTEVFKRSHVWETPWPVGLISKAPYHLRDLEAVHSDGEICF